MAYGKLAPKLEQYAAQLGREAGQLRELGQRFGPCPWDTQDPSLTRRRLANAWLDAFTATVPGLAQPDTVG